MVRWLAAGFAASFALTLTGGWLLYRWVDRGLAV
jgi:hypothetical protein